MQIRTAVKHGFHCQSNVIKKSNVPHLYEYRQMEICTDGKAAN
jgi:hypothetical protein